MGNKGGKPDDGQQSSASGTNNTSSSTTTPSSRPSQPVAATPTAATSGQPVSLLVYEPAEAQMSMPGLGIYHSGLEVYGAEYSFAGNGTRATGVYSQRPRYTPPDFPWRFKEEIKLGFTQLTKQELKQLVAELSSQFAGNTYHLTSRNCNHFTEAFTVALGLTYPAWVNRAARVGDSMRGLFGDSTTGGAGGPGGAGTPAAAAANGGRSVDFAPKPVENRDLAVTGAVDLPQVACLNAVGRGAALVCDPKRPKGTFLQSDADEQLLLFIPLKRVCKLHSMMMALPIGPRANHSPRIIKVFKNRLNLNFDDAATLPASSYERFDMDALAKAETKQATPTAAAMALDGFVWVTIPLRFVAWQDVSHITIFVETNGGSDTSILGGIQLIGQDPSSP